MEVPAATFPVTVTVTIESKADPKTGLRENPDAARARLIAEARSQALVVATGYTKLVGGGDADLRGLGDQGIVERDGKLTVQFTFGFKGK